MGSVSTSSRVVWLSLYFLVEMNGFGLHVTWCVDPLVLVGYPVTHGVERGPWLRQVYRLVEVEHCSLPCVFMHLEAKALKRVDGHSIWQFQDDGKESYPKAVRVPANPRGEIADRAFYAAPSIRHVEVAAGIQHLGIAAWQSCQQLQIVKLPTSVVSLAEGTFMGCYVLRQVAAPGCVHCGQRVFAECCSLGSVGVKCETEDSSVLAPGAQLGRYAFESCLTLATVTFNTDRTNKPRALPEGAFCGAGIEQLCLPHDFHNIGPRACENCKSLVEVNLMSTEITALLSSTFAHCVALPCLLRVRAAATVYPPRLGRR